MRAGAGGRGAAPRQRPRFATDLLRKPTPWRVCRLRQACPRTGRADSCSVCGSASSQWPRPFAIAEIAGPAWAQMRAAPGARARSSRSLRVWVHVGQAWAPVGAGDLLRGRSLLKAEVGGSDAPIHERRRLGVFRVFRRVRPQRRLLERRADFVLRCIRAHVQHSASLRLSVGLVHHPQRHRRFGPHRSCFGWTWVGGGALVGFAGSSPFGETSPLCARFRQLGLLRLYAIDVRTSHSVAIDVARGEGRTDGGWASLRSYSVSRLFLRVRVTSSYLRSDGIGMPRGTRKQSDYVNES